MAETNISVGTSMNQYESIEDHLNSNSNAACQKTIVNRLHEYLDFYQLFDSFIDELRAAVPFDSIEYEEKNNDIVMKNGYVGNHKCEYTLNYEGISLGKILLSRETQWLDSELDLIEVMLAGLTLPLRNALQYQSAIRSAQRDELTGLRNGSYYRDIVDLEIERAQRYKDPFSLLIFDLDDFEKVNTQYGRQAGDVILKEIAERIEIKARSSDVVYRYGSDEFLIFLPNTEKNEARIVAQRIKDYVFRKPFKFENKNIIFTLSAGVVTVTHNDTADKLFDRADKALFHAKVLGKDRIYSDSLSENVKFDTSVETNSGSIQE